MGSASVAQPVADGADAALLRRTPCIGVCSTTYGDLVCRGCKRFAHEIVQWNGYEASQQRTVWQRLETLRDASVATFAEVADEAKLSGVAARLRVPAKPPPSALGMAYEVLRRASAAALPTELGLQPKPAVADLNVAGLFAAIDREYYARATAFYERSFRTQTH